MDTTTLTALLRQLLDTASSAAWDDDTDTLDALGVEDEGLRGLLAEVSSVDDAADAGWLVTRDGSSLAVNVGTRVLLVQVSVAR